MREISRFQVTCVVTSCAYVVAPMTSATSAAENSSVTEARRQCIEAFRLPRGGPSCFLSANPRPQDLPVRVVLGPELPPSRMRVGEAARLRRQRHQQQQALLRITGSHEL